MKSITLLLIPLLLLSSCTIDWNDEKDKKITEQVIKENFDVIKEVFSFLQSNSPVYPLVDIITLQETLIF